MVLLDRCPHRRNIEISQLMGIFNISKPRTSKIHEEIIEGIKINIKKRQPYFIRQETPIILNIPTKARNRLPPKVFEVERQNQLLMQEDFEDKDFPRPDSLWSVYDGDGLENGEYYFGYNDDDFFGHIYEGEGSVWCAKGGRDGKDLKPGLDDYPSNCNSWLVYGPFSLKNAVDCKLTFHYWLDSEYIEEFPHEASDWFCIFASTDGRNFYGKKFAGQIREWRYAEFNLSDVPGLGDITNSSSIWIAFVFESNEFDNYDGVYIDNVRLYASPPGWIDITEEDFEDEFPDPESLWITYDGDGNINGEYYWARDDFKPHGGNYSAWCAGGGEDGLDPENNNYPNNCNSWLVYGPFSLRNATNARLSFHLWIKSELLLDGLLWGVSTGGLIYPISSISGNSNGWLSREINLGDVPDFGSDLLGTSTVWIVFLFSSNDTNTEKGVFIDDIKIKKYVPSSANITSGKVTGMIFPEDGDDVLQKNLLHINM
jgi:hypothetical protein